MAYRVRPVDQRLEVKKSVAWGVMRAASVESIRARRIIKQASFLFQSNSRGLTSSEERYRPIWALHSVFIAGKIAAERRSRFAVSAGKELMSFRVRPSFRD